MHRLKDLARPEHLFDLVIAGLPSEFPPIRSLEVPIDLPEQLTSFVGRQRGDREPPGSYSRRTVSSR